MDDPAAAGTDETSIPSENTRNGRIMNGVMRRKAGTKTFPWEAAAVNQTPPIPPLNTLEYFIPFAANPAPPPPPQDEDIPAAKRPRLVTSSSMAADIGVGLLAAVAHTRETVTTASPSDIADDVPRDVVTVSPPLPRRSWNSEDDVKLTEAVRMCGNDWVVVAALVPGRTNVQCRERWANRLDPTTNQKMGKWRAEEDAKLIEGVEKHGNKWLAVASLVPNRNHKECRQRWVGNLDPNINQKMGKWRAEEDEKLAGAVQKHGNDWFAVAALVPGRNNKDCRQRWAANLDPNINRKMGKWTAGEDAKLIGAVQQHGKDWVAVAAMVPGRTNVQCRAAWSFRFEPTIEATPTNRGKWTEEEDEMLIDAVRKCGKGDWDAVAALVPSRTSVQCRTIWTIRVGPTVEGKPPNFFRWTPEEDAKLTEAVRKCGKDWIAVAPLVPGRTNLQCRQRWVRYVDPAIVR
jgi:hypothetical protein